MSNNNNKSKSSKEVFNDLSEGTLLDAAISEIRIFEENYVLNIMVALKTVRNGAIRILFEDITEYYFNYHKSRGFYNVEDYKFVYLEEAEEYYISFDPDQSVDEISANDSDLIRSKALSLM